MDDVADLLQELIENSSMLAVWGDTTHRAVSDGVDLDKLSKWVAMRESDRTRLKHYHPDWSANRHYRADSLPERISEAFSDLLFGEPPTIQPESDRDKENMEELISENQLPTELKRWAADCSSEGEVWYRIYVDLEASSRPILEMHSRLDVVPYWVGRKVGAVAFFNELVRNEIKDGKDVVAIEVFRHVEIQAKGFVRNLLYKGDSMTLGERVELESRPETAELEEEWHHGLELTLAGRIPNKLGRNWRIGVSDYSGIEDQLFDLNEARTVMAENVRLAAKKRMVVPAAALDENGNFDAGDDVIPVESLDTELGKEGDKAGAYAILEYNFDAAPVIAHMSELEKTALTRVGLNVQFVNGSSDSGDAAATGVALRTRLIPTTLAAQGRGRHWDSKMPDALCAMQQVDNLPVEQGGCGNSWTKPQDPPSFERGTVLPEDDTEKATRHSTLMQSELESQETALRDLHPGWDDKAIEEEIKQIKIDRLPFTRESLGLPPLPGADAAGLPPGEGDFPPGENPQAPPEEDADSGASGGTGSTEVA